MTPEREQYLGDMSLQSWSNRLPVVLYLCLLVVVGAVGNVVSFLVYFFRFPDSSTRVFVLAMSICDLVTNVVGLPLQILTIRYAYDSFDLHLCRSMFIFATIPTQASGLYLVLVAFDRYQRICKPFEKHISSGQAWKLVAGATGAATLLFVPFTGFYGHHTVNISRHGVDAVMCWVHDPYRDTFYSSAYLIVVGVTFCAGLLLMATFYLLIGMTVFRRRFGRNFSQTNPTSLALRRRQSDADDVSGTTSDVGFSKVTSSVEPRHVIYHIPAIVIDCPDDRKPETIPDGEDMRGGSINTVPRHEDPPTDVTTRLTMEQQVRDKDTTRTSSLYTRRSKHYRQKSRTTLMMAVLTGLYIANWLPHLIIRLLRSDPVNMCEDFTDCGMNIYGVCLRSYYLNSAVNALVYSFCNPRFRLQCRLLFTRRPCHGC